MNLCTVQVAARPIICTILTRTAAARASHTRLKEFGASHGGDCRVGRRLVEA